jgi:NADPH-dependent curcumin reductase CurA
MNARLDRCRGSSGASRLLLPRFTSTIRDPLHHAMNRQIVLRSRPRGMPTSENFGLIESPVPQPNDGEVLIKHEFVGIVPAARLRMSEGPSYAAPTPIDHPVYGQAVGTVITSRHKDFKPGDAAVTMAGGWQDYSVARGDQLVKADTALAPKSVWLGALGTSGFTAYVGVLKIARLKPSDTVVVSAATGAVGSVAGQVAKLHGCRVIGIAGGAQKCEIAVRDYGFDDCVDHKAADLGDRLAALTPEGVNVYFENVGGRVRDAVWPLMVDGGRVAVCGLISEYNDEKAAGPGWFPVLTRRLQVTGFIVGDHEEFREEFHQRMGRWYSESRVRVREDISVGLESAPSAFIGLLNGKNLGKTLVQV